MRHSKALLLLLLLVSLTASPLFATERPPSASNGNVRIGDKAPAFDLTTIDGKKVSMEESIGKKATIIVFWSFFCFPCQAEMPILQAMYDELVADNVSLIAISLDGPQYDDLVLPFLKENKITFPVAYDRETAEFFETADKFGVVGTPSTFILDDTGRIRFMHLGRLEASVLRGIIDSVDTKSFCADIIKTTSSKKVPDVSADKEE